MDRLPIEILHLILGFLSTKEAARISVVSKQWHKAWSTIPDLDFQQHLFTDKCFFFKYATGTMVRYEQQGIPMTKLSLDVAVVDENVATLVNRWIRTASECCGAKEVFLNFKSLPTSLSGTVYPIEELVTMHFCQNKDRLDGMMMISSPWGVRTDYPCNLKELTLNGVFLNEDLFQNLISRCPLVEALTLLKCKGLKEIQVANLTKLKSFRVKTLENQRVVVINVPSLQVLMYSSQYTCLLDVEGTHNVKQLKLSSTTITDECFRKTVSKFPLLEVLLVKQCYMVQRINVSSSSLRTLELDFCPDLVEVTIDAPNLKKFNYYGNTIPSFSFTEISNPGINNKRESSVGLTCSERLLDNSWFQKLSEFLKIFRPSDQIMLIIESQEVSFSITQDLRDQMMISSKPELESLFLHVDYSPRLQFATLMEGLLWSCSPKAVLVTWRGSPVVGDHDIIEYPCQRS